MSEFDEPSDDLESECDCCGICITDSSDQSNLSNYDNLNSILKLEAKIINPYYYSGINNIVAFPSGKLILISDKDIKIYDKKFKIIEKIYNAHKTSMIDIQIKNEYNFVTSSDEYIIFWKKNINLNKFILYQKIYLDKELYIKLIFINNGNLVTASDKGLIKIWKRINNSYQNIKILEHSDRVEALLFCENKNLLISTGYNGSKFWDLNNYECILRIEDFRASFIQRIDDDKFVFGGYNCYLSTISINEKNGKRMTEGFNCLCLLVDQQNKYIFVGTKGGTILVYNIDNYELIYINIKVHENGIIGIYGNYRTPFTHKNTVFPFIIFHSVVIKHILTSIGSKILSVISENKY